MRIALLGLAGSGKTTVFNAVATTPAATSPGSFQTETHIQVVPVRDPRLERCRELFQPKKYTPAGLELSDPPGLPTGSSEPDKERRARLLSAAREADAFVLVVRGFASPNYAYDRAEPDPRADLEQLLGELVAADYVIAEGRAQRLRENIQRKAKSMDQDKLELAVLDRCLERLDAGRDLLDLELDEADDKRLRGFQLFTRKPHMLLLNGPGEVPPDLGADAPVALRGRMAMDAQIDAELSAMDPADRPAFMEEFGIVEAAAERFVREVYGAVGLLSFFTVGEDEVRAWTIHRGDSAVVAAGRIHTDLAKGFVRAEVFSFDVLSEAGSMRELKARGAIRLEPKDYVVKDGDIVHIRSAL
jgi:GTP-binding protein YchF